VPQASLFRLGCGPARAQRRDSTSLQFSDGFRLEVASARDVRL